MKLRFSPLYVDGNNVLTEEGSKLRESYISKGGLDANFFSMIQPLLSVGTEKSKCPKPLLPLLNEFESKGIIVEVKEERSRPKEDVSALIEAKESQIADDLKKDHVLTPRNKPAILEGEMNSSLDLNDVKNGKEVIQVLLSLSKDIAARVVLIKKVNGEFKGLECSATTVGVVKIRLATLVYNAANVYKCFALMDKRIRSDKSAREPDCLSETVTISRSKKATLYMISNFHTSPERYILAVTALPKIGDGLVLLGARKAIKKLDQLLS